MKYFICFLVIVFITIQYNIIRAQNNVKFELLDRNVVDYTIFKDEDNLAIVKLDCVEIWDLKCNNRISILENQNGSKNHCADISKGNKFLAIGTKNGEVVLWDLNSSKVVWNTVIGGLITDLKIAPDNLSIAAGSSNSNIYKINIIDGSIISELKQHSLDITSIEFSKDGLYLFSTSADKSIIIWDYVNEKLTNQLYGHKSWVRDLTISPDETRMISVGDDGLLLFWNISDVKNSYEMYRERVGFSWLTSVKYYKDGSSYLYSTINGRLTFITNYAVSKSKLDNIILKAEFVNIETDQINLIILLKDVGVKVVNSSFMEMK